MVGVIIPQKLANYKSVLFFLKTGLLSIYQHTADGLPLWYFFKEAFFYYPV